MASTQQARITVLHNVEIQTQKPFIAYWCFKSLRARYNHGLEYAIYLANKYSMPLIAFCTLPPAQAMPLRQGLFTLEGIESLCKDFALREIPCMVLLGHCSAAAAYMTEHAAAMIVDCVYLKEDKILYKEMKAWARCRIIQVESNVVVPISAASNKEEYAAATLRPQIHARLHNYLQPLVPVKIKNPSLSFSHPSLVFPKRFQLPHSKESYTIEQVPTSELHQKAFIQRVTVNHCASVATLKGGESCAQEALQQFIQNKLSQYAEKRNDPSADCQSGMSAYLRFGHISPVDIALRVLEASECRIESVLQNTQAGESGVLNPILKNVQAFLEELIVRRELSYNFICYNSNYNTYAGALPQWAQKTLSDHKTDKRLMVYSFEDMENANTEDDYWNAAQLQMKKGAYMHGYMRMYWGKKILEWSEEPEQAFLFSIAQNDRYHMDGCDPNGYTGVAWCYGKHDRPWPERPIFGVVRYMNAQGIRRKYKNINAYVQKWL